jgi:hypothetical protein
VNSTKNSTKTNLTSLALNSSLAPRPKNYLHITKAMLSNADTQAVVSPNKIGLQSKNPYGDFSGFEQQVDKMKPVSVMPKEQAAKVAANLIEKWKELDK